MPYLLLPLNMFVFAHILCSNPIWSCRPAQRAGHYEHSWQVPDDQIDVLWDWHMEAKTLVGFDRYLWAAPSITFAVTSSLRLYGRNTPSEAKGVR